MISAELRRNLWLEISQTRLTVIPLMLALIFWGLGSLHEFTSLREPAIDYPYLAGAALILFTLICTLWGAHLASSSITEEAQAQTWDWQRLSSQSPTELLIGKLFGSTALAWYGGAWCIAAYLVFSLLGGHTPSLGWLCLSIAGAVFIQASALLITLGTPPDQRPIYLQKRGFGAMRLLVILIVLQSMAGLGVQLAKSSTVTQWYGVDISLLPFMAGSAVFWAAWAVFGCVQRLSTLLRCPTTPTPWLLFALWCMFYFAGFTHDLALSGRFGLSSGSYYGLTSYLVALGLALLLALQEDKSPVPWRMWLTSLRNRHFPLAWQRTPRWIATLALAFVALCFAALTTPEISPWLLASPLLLLLRDTAVLYSLYWTPRRTRPQLAFSIYLLLIYLLLPFLLTSFKPIFYPSTEFPALSALSFVIEAMLAAAFCLHRWNQFYED